MRQRVHDISKAICIPRVSSSDGRSVGSDSGPQVGALFGHGPGDGAAFHFAFVVDDDAGVVLEIQRDAVFTVIRLALTNHHRGDYLQDDIDFPMNVAIITNNDQKNEPSS